MSRRTRLLFVATLLVFVATGWQLLAAPTPKGTIALVAGAEGGVLQMIDLTDNTLIATIPIFDETSRNYAVIPFDVKATPDGRWAYVSSAATRQVFVVDLVLRKVATVLQVRHGPTELAISPDGSFVYVSCSLSGYDQMEYISVIATKDHTVFHEIPTEVAPLGIAFTPDGKWALVTNPAVGDAAGGTVTLIDATTHTIKGSVLLGGTPAAVAVHPDGRYAYVTNTIAGAVMVLDLQATPPAVAGTLELGALTTPTSIAVAPDGKGAQVVNSFMGMITILDLANPASPAVAGQVAVGTLPTDVVYSFDGGFSYVSNTGANSISVIDNTLQPPGVVATIELGDVHPRGIDLARRPADVLVELHPQEGLPYIIPPGGQKSWNIEIPVNPSEAVHGELILTAFDIDAVSEARVRVNRALVPLPPEIVNGLTPKTARIPIPLTDLVVRGNTVTITDLGGTDGFRIDDLAIALRFDAPGPFLQKSTELPVPNDNVLHNFVNAYLLAANFPNPFNPSTTIDFQIPKDSRVTITVFNTNGQLIRTLVDGNLQAGAHRVQWDGLDEQGNHVAAGMYLCRMKAGDFMDTKRMIMVK
ncbi:MAG: T9SS type A sorting domain-containing protein [Calditrichaeota bacterium]|nr:T9SS type A sorting domain-containing protein [Calditrichota bacterium]